jgi:membrane-bound serine protease (ClpP class)
MKYSSQMKSSIRLIALLLVIISSASIYSQSNPGKAIILQINGAIGPATSDYVEDGLKQATEMQARLVIIQLDTPGGLDVAMRDIIQNIIGSSIPVAIYVSPSGARAASAGTYMLYASHIAAMAPGTNLGAATPVQIGGLPDLGGIPSPEEEESGELDGEQGGQDESPAMPSDPMASKMVNDAVAYIRSLAEMRDRNADWAEQAVREAASLSSAQALDQNVIDLIATDIPDLLNKINGMTVMVDTTEIVLQTADLTTEVIEPDWRNRLLSVITNPNVAYVLMLLGIYGLFFELANPGFVLPGVIGAISLLLALYALQVLPVNYAGLGLIFLGIIFMTAEMFAPSFGALGIGGIISFIVGSIILFDKEGAIHREFIQEAGRFRQGTDDWEYWCCQ